MTCLHSKNEEPLPRCRLFLPVTHRLCSFGLNVIVSLQFFLVWLVRHFLIHHM